MGDRIDLTKLSDAERAKLLTEALRGYTPEATAELFGRYHGYRGAPTTARIEDALILQRIRWVNAAEDSDVENLTPPETLRAAFGDPLERTESESRCPTCGMETGGSSDPALHATSCSNVNPPRYDAAKDMGRQELDGVILEDDGRPSTDQQGLTPEGPVLGYDLVAPMEEAVVMCAYLVHVSVKAMNDAHNEPTLPWEDNKASVIAGVRRVIENPAETPEQNHNAWMASKAAEGWTYGPTKSAEAKTHPCMVPYDALTPAQQQKDMVFLAIVRAMFVGVFE